MAQLKVCLKEGIVSEWKGGILHCNFVVCLYAWNQSAGPGDFYVRVLKGLTLMLLEPLLLLFDGSRYRGKFQKARKKPSLAPVFEQDISWSQTRILFVASVSLTICWESNLRLWLLNFAGGIKIICLINDSYLSNKL